MSEIKTQDLSSKLARARQQLKKAEAEVATLEALLERGEHFSLTQGSVGERNRAQAFVSANEAALRIFVEQAPAAIAMLDVEMKYLLVSQRWLTDYQLTET